MTRIQKKVRFTPEELHQLNENQKRSGILTFQDYARQMLLTGVIIHVELEELSTLNFELNRIGHNFNQLVKKTHLFDEFTHQDLKKLHHQFHEIFERILQAEKQLLRFIEKEGTIHGVRETSQPS